MKRFLLFTLIIALLMIPTAQADESPMRKFKLEATVSGDELDVRIYADLTYQSATVGLESIDFGMSYSQDILELIESVKTGDALESDILNDSFFFEENTTEAGKYRLSAFSITGNAATGLLVHLRFKIIGEGYYGFRLLRDRAEYSVYDSATGTQMSYQLPRMEIDAEVTGTGSIADPVEETKEPKPDAQNEPKEEKTENGFLRFLRSIFGSSCFGG